MAWLCMPTASRALPALPGQKPWQGWALLLIVLLYLPGVATADLWFASGAINAIDLQAHGRLYQAGDEAFPADAADLAAWLSQYHTPGQVSLLGGAYWLYAEIRQPQAGSDWVFNPDNTLIEQVEARVYAPDGTLQTLSTGYRHSHEYLLHYGKRLQLAPGQDYRILVRFSSPYFASYPNFTLLPEAQYRHQSSLENLVIIGCFGALAALALFNLFIHSLARDKSRFYYAVYLVVYGTGWAFTFHIPSELFGLYNLHLHYLPFFLIPVCSTLFYLEFLRLPEKFPRLAQISRINLILPLALLPSCWLALSYAHLLATFVLSIWLLLALACGIVCWRGGFRPARYFTVAFTALLLPGLVILPANAGLLPDLVENAELYTLLGGTLDALLLSFALADNIKLMEQEKDSYLQQLNLALKQAHTDGLTGLGNRYAFDQLLQRQFQFLAPPKENSQHLLAIIDLDGLKYINDHHGHAAGDELLLAMARGLADLYREGIVSFRLGGDEFAIVAPKNQEARLHEALGKIEQTLAHLGYSRAGLSYGIAYAHECASPADLFNISDQRMYQNKLAKRQKA
jgi:diguanylate cyclase (GGDEF)-like protein